MIVPNLAVLRTAVVLLSAALWCQSSHAQSTDTSKFSEELSKQAGIYNSKGSDVPEGYVTGRSLLSYEFTLPEDFKKSLPKLGPEDKWLDIGAGEGRAVLDYATARYDVLHAKEPERSGKKAKAVAISIEDRRTHHWYQTSASLEPNQIQYFFGKSFRDYSLQELGKFKIITDLLGAFSYTRDIAVFMEKALGFLETDGSLYTVLQDVHSEEGSNRPHYPNAPFLTEITRADGSELKVCSWLKSISCVQVTCELKGDWTPPIEVYRVHKVCDDVQVPPLAPTHFQAGTPPERRFQLTQPLPASLAGTPKAE